MHIRPAFFLSHHANTTKQLAIMCHVCHFDPINHLMPNGSFFGMKFFFTFFLSLFDLHYANDDWCWCFFFKKKRSVIYSLSSFFSFTKKFHCFISGIWFRNSKNFFLDIFLCPFGLFHHWKFNDIVCVCGNLSPYIWIPPGWEKKRFMVKDVVGNFHYHRFIIAEYCYWGYRHTHRHKHLILHPFNESKQIEQITHTYNKFEWIVFVRFRFF